MPAAPLAAAMTVVRSLIVRRRAQVTLALRRNKNGGRDPHDRACRAIEAHSATHPQTHL